MIVRVTVSVSKKNKVSSQSCEAGNYKFHTAGTREFVISNLSGKKNKIAFGNLLS